MNSVEFDKVVEGCIDKIKSVLQKKSQEYSSDDDKLHNFDKAKDLMRCKTKEYALLGMLNKHLVSVIDLIEKYENIGKLPESDLLDEKIGDSINYFILLKACFLDDIGKREEEIVKEHFECGCERYKQRVDDDKLRKKVYETANVTDKKDIETLKKEQAMIANSLYINPRKRLVVENLRKMLKSLFVWLSDNNRFTDYGKIKKILNKAELEKDSVPDEFIKDVVVAIEQIDMDCYYEKNNERDMLVTDLVRFMLSPKYKFAETVWYIGTRSEEINWQVVGCMTIYGMGLFNDKQIYYVNLSKDVVYEKNCFKTAEEAREECNKRNNKNTKI